MRIGVLALQGDFLEHSQMLRTLGAEVVEVRLPADLDGLDGLVIPGGESTTIARLLIRYDLLEPLRQRIRGGMPTMGTCAGMIVMAQRAQGLDREGLGLMNIDVKRNAFGRQVDSFEADLPMPAVAASETVKYPVYVVERVGLTSAELSGLTNSLRPVLGEGELQRAITVRAHKFSKSAAEKIAAAGGKAEVITT